MSVLSSSEYFLFPSYALKLCLTLGRNGLIIRYNVIYFLFYFKFKIDATFNITPLSYFGFFFIHDSLGTCIPTIDISPCVVCIRLDTRLLDGHWSRLNSYHNSVSVNRYIIARLLIIYIETPWKGNCKRTFLTKNLLIF